VITTALRVEEIDGKLRARMLDGSRCTFFVLDAPSYRGPLKQRRRKSR
jgi:hypothetical protein